MDNASVSESITVSKFISDSLQNEQQMLEKQRDYEKTILDLQQQNLLTHITISNLLMKNDNSAENRLLFDKAKEKLKKFLNVNNLKSAN